MIKRKKLPLDYIKTRNLRPDFDKTRKTEVKKEKNKVKLYNVLYNFKKYIPIISMVLKKMYFVISELYSVVIFVSKISIKMFTGSSVLRQIG